MDMLQGPTVQDNLIQRFDLRKVYWDRYWEDARKDLTKHTEITEDRKSGVISVAVSDHDPAAIAADGTSLCGRPGSTRGTGVDLCGPSSTNVH